MKSPMKKDGKKGDLLSRGIEFLKETNKKIGKAYDKTVNKKINKGIKAVGNVVKKVSKDIKQRGT